MKLEHETVLQLLRKIEASCHGAMDGARQSGGRAVDCIPSFASIKRMACEAQEVLTTQINAGESS